MFHTCTANLLKKAGQIGFAVLKVSLLPHLVLVAYFQRVYARAAKVSLNKTMGQQIGVHSTELGRLLSVLCFGFLVQFADYLPAQARGLRFSGAESQQQQQNLAGQSTQEVVTLELGKPVERELRGGLKHSYQIALTKGQYIRVEIKQKGIFVGVTIQAPEEKAVIVIDPLGTVQEPIIQRVAEYSGIYRLNIYSRAKASAGHYEIRIAELRAANEDELALQQARELKEKSIALHREGEYAKALPLLTRALEIRERLAGPNSRGAAEILGYLATNYQNTGDYRSAEPLLQRALKIIEELEGPSHPDVADWVRRLGLFYHRKGDYLKAEELLQKALAIFEKTERTENINVPSLLGNLGDIYYELGENDQAEKYYQRSHAVWEKLLGPEHYHLATSFTRLGRAAYAAGDYTRAEAAFGRALDLTKKTFGHDHFQLTQPLADLAMLHSTRGEYVKAEELYRRALAIHEQKTALSHPHAQEVLFGMGRLYAAQGRLSEAVESQSRASEIEERHIELNIAVGSEHERLNHLATMSARAARNLSLHASLAPDDRAARDLALTTILRRKGRVQDAMTDSFAALRRRASAEDDALLEELRNTMSELARLILNWPQYMTLAEHQNRVKSLEEKKGKVEAEIGRRSAGFYETRQPITLAAIQAAIPEHAALIEFAVYRPFDAKASDELRAYGESRYVVYVVRRQGEVRWKDLGETKTIDSDLNAFRRTLRDPQMRSTRKLSRSLDEKLMRPVRALIGDASQLLVSPDGELNLIPFEALIDEQGRYQIERYSFAYLTSGRDLLRLQILRESKSAPVVIADPAFGEPSLIADSRSVVLNGDGRAQINYSKFFFGPLPGVGDEVRALKTFLPTATFFTGAQATEGNLKSVKGPSILHVATHGFFMKNTTRENTLSTAKSPEATRPANRAAFLENPLLRSGLALAGANQGLSGDDDGVLTALEATALDLWGTKLVVLSACDTGVGEVKNGDGVYGLRRALFLAGTESQLMSLWPVSDRSTRELMASFYQQLVHDAGRGEALRRAQLAMLRDSSRRHPYYWASFIMAGEWANLKGRR